MASRSVVTFFLSLFFPIWNRFPDIMITNWTTIFIILTMKNQGFFNNSPTSILTSPDNVIEAVHCGSTRIVLLNKCPYITLAITSTSHWCEEQGTIMGYSISVFLLYHIKVGWPAFCYTGCYTMLMPFSSIFSNCIESNHTSTNHYSTHNHI